MADENGDIKYVSVEKAMNLWRATVKTVDKPGKISKLFETKEAAIQWGKQNGAEWTFHADAINLWGGETETNE